MEHIATPKISVIIPIYNVELYLRQCLDSIVNQTYRNLEIILIDDGSSDNCGKICDEYAEKDSRVIVIHKENGGLSAARNDGLACATGKWISFIDSDDWCELNLYEQAVSQAEKIDSDIIIYSLYRGSSKIGGRETRIQTFDKEFVTTDKTVLFQLQLAALSCKYIPFSKTQPWTMGFPWDKLYKASLIFDNNLQFTEDVKAHEDVIFNLHAFQYANKVSFFNVPLYHFRINPASIGHKYNPNRAEEELRIDNEFYRIGKLYHLSEEYYKAMNIRIVYNMIGLGKICFFNKNNPEKLINKLKYARKILHTEPIYTAFEQVDRKKLGKTGKIITINRHNNTLVLLFFIKISSFLNSLGINI